MNRFEVLVPPQELNLPLSVASGQTFRWRRSEENGKGAWEGVDGTTWFHVSIDSSGALTRFEVDSNQDEAAFRWAFRLDQRLGELNNELIGQHQELARCFAAAPGLRVLRQSSPEEVFFNFLCTPNNNVERIRRMVDHLETFGEPLHGLVHRRSLPGAPRIASISEDDLRNRGFGYRARTIPLAARQLLERGDGWLDQLKGAPYVEAHAELCRIDGIGPKLADCICLFGLDHSEAVPVDTHLWQVACRDYFPEWDGKSLTQGRYREIGDLFRERFGRNAGLVHQYLFYENLQRYRSNRAKQAEAS